MRVCAAKPNSLLYNDLSRALPFCAGSAGSRPAKSGSTVRVTLSRNLSALAALAALAAHFGYARVAALQRAAIERTEKHVATGLSYPRSRARETQL